MARSAAKWRKLAPGLRGGGLNLLLGGGHDARALLTNGRLDARLVLLALFFHLGANLGNLAIQAGELGFNRAQPRLGLRSRLAGRLQVIAHLFAARAQNLGQSLVERNADQQHNDAEVDELEDRSRRLRRCVQRLGRPLDHRAFQPEDVVLLFLRLGLASGLAAPWRRARRMPEPLPAPTSRDRRERSWPAARPATKFGNLSANGAFAA